MGRRFLNPVLPRMKTKIHLLLLMLYVSTSALFSSPQDKPNFIIFIADDVSWNDIGCYGNDDVQTPIIDELASRGLRFTNAYLTASSCSPSRNSILLGRYPHNTGAAELHSQPPDNDVISFPELLKNADYHTVFSGKYHQGDYCLRAFDVISREYEEIKNSGQGMWLKNLKDRPRDKPFFMWFASLDAHRDWGPNEFSGTHDPESIEVPAYLADAEATREDLARYYDEVYRFDHSIGRIIDELRDQGVYENTVIIVMADNGRPFPHSKTLVNDQGVKTPFVIHWPEEIQGGEVSQSLVSVIDIAPTVADLAGVEPAESFQGKSFRELLQEPERRFRNYVFAEHNWHDYEAHQRMVRDEHFMYIRNSRPNLSLMGPADSISSPSHRDLVALKAKGLLSEIQNDIFITPRAYETLYNCQEDPMQLLNVASVPEHAKALNHLRGILNQWIEETGDTVPDFLTGDWFLKVPGYIPTDQHEVRGEMPGDEKAAIHINHPGPF